MKTVLFGDVHGNLPAMERMLDEEKDADGFICLGDLVNYGPWSNECVELAFSLSHCVLIKGNHEEAYLEKHYDGQNEIAKAFFDYCYPSFIRYDLIGTMRDEYMFKEFSVQHTIGDRYIYPDTEIQIQRNYIIAHSHYQFKRSINGFMLYNTGSVGQNRQYINKIDYMVYDDNSNSFLLKSLIYDVDIVINEMKQRGYPDLCIAYYQNKKRY